MKITRIINGTTVEIELTRAELNTAYWEAQQNFDREDVDFHLENYDDDPDQFERELGISLETFRANCLPYAGERLRRWIERYEDHNDYMFDARESAIMDAAKHYLDTQKSA